MSFVLKAQLYADRPQGDSVGMPVYIADKIRYESKYPFIQYQNNFFEWNDPTIMRPLFQALQNTNKKKAKVVHIGDSHVQADIYTGHLRNIMQNTFGHGGRGMIFPYAAAKTHSGNDYFTYSRGVWSYCRNVNPAPVHDLGFSGATVRTNDVYAGFRIVFNKFYTEENNTVVKIYCKSSPESFDLVLHLDNQPTAIRVTCSDASKPYVEVTLPFSPRVIDVAVSKTLATQKFFECHGLSLESPEDSGILYHSVGINGANLHSLIKQNLMIDQIREINPDVVVLDEYGNEFNAYVFNEAEFRDRLRRVIAMLKEAAPNATIIVASTQDAFYRRAINIAFCKTAAEIVKEYALSNGCAYYDYYNISGGQYAIKKWRAYELSQADLVHLTFKGYRAKGELFCNALLNSYYQYLNGSPFPPTPDRLPEAAFAKTAPDIVVPPPTPAVAPPAYSATKYKVKAGDNLGKIASNYGVTVAAIQQWNGLKGTMIREGQLLTIWPGKKVTVNAPAPKPAAPAANNASPKTTTTAAPKTATTTPKTTAPTTVATKKTHKVASGENLWAIARKYGTTVEKIMKTNNLKSDKLQVGQSIVIN